MASVTSLAYFSSSFSFLVFHFVLCRSAERVETGRGRLCQYTNSEIIIHPAKEGDAVCSCHCRVAQFVSLDNHKPVLPSFFLRVELFDVLMFFFLYGLFVHTSRTCKNVCDRRSPPVLQSKQSQSQLDSTWVTVLFTHSPCVGVCVCLFLFRLMQKVKKQI